MNPQLLVAKKSLLGYPVYPQNFLNHFGSGTIFNDYDNELDNNIHHWQT
jgi:hypothetical protein